MANVSSSNSLGERVPKLRFPDTKGDFFAEYIHSTVRDLFTRITQRNTEGLSNVITNSAEYGLIPQRDFFDKDIAVDGNTASYYVIKSGDFVYNPRKSNQAPYGPFNCYDYMDEGIVSPLYTCLRPKMKEYTEFLLWYFKSPVWHSYIYHNGAQGGARHDRVGMTTELMDGIPINLPDINEQQKIVSFLNLIERKITIQSQLVELLKLYKRGLLSKLFPQKGESVPQYRFEGFTDAWEQRKLGEIVEFLDTLRKPLEGSKRASGSYPYYGASGIVDYVDDYIFDEELVLLSEDGANITDRNYPVCFIISGKTWVNNHAHVLKAKEGFDNNFLCNSLERKDYTPYNTGMAMPKLNKEVCKNIPVECPNYEEQKKIGSYLDSLDNLITLHQKKYDFFEKEKMTLLQQMFI